MALGVTERTVWNWAKGASRPRRTMVARINRRMQEGASDALQEALNSDHLTADGLWIRKPWTSRRTLTVSGACMRSPGWQ